MKPFEAEVEAGLTEALLHTGRATILQDIDPVPVEVSDPEETPASEEPNPALETDLPEPAARVVE